MKCPECGGATKSVETSVSMPNFEITISQKGHQCVGGCKLFPFYTARQLLDADLEIATLLMKRKPDRVAFRYVRQILGLTGKQMAASLGVRYETVSRWETGTRKISLPVWKLLAEKVKAKVESP